MGREKLKQRNELEILPAVFYGMEMEMNRTRKDLLLL